jgi:hypothetical protein
MPIRGVAFSDHRNSAESMWYDDLLNQPALGSPAVND